VLSLAKAVKDYYLQKLGEISPREDYYLRGGTATGRWCGSGAAELGLTGAVSAEGLVRLFDGNHPDTGEQLGRRLRTDGVAAWDVTFSADKSVSLLWALGDELTRKEVLEAFEESTSQAFEYLESVASFTRGATKTPVVDKDGNRVRGPNGRLRYRVETWPIATSGYVAAAFTEYTSRADDPQLHTHVVVANKVKGADGMWRTIDGRLLYRHQLAAGYLHEAVLRRELTQRLGVQWQPIHHGVADIAGFTLGQIEAFSQRRRQLETWRQEESLPDTAAARQVAVIATRTAKTNRSLDELEEVWQRRAVEVGLTPERIGRIVNRSMEVTSPDREALFADLASPDGLTAHKSTFATPEVIQHIAAAFPEGGTRTEIEALADTFLKGSDIIPLLPSPQLEPPAQAGTNSLAEPNGRQLVDEARVPVMRTRRGEPFPAPTLPSYTTAELLATEQRIVDYAMAGVGQGRWQAPHRLVETWLRNRPELTDGQRQMVRSFATSGNTVDIGIGPAGSGKTAVVAVVNQLAQLTRRPIIGAALAARTASGLQTDTGVPSTTLARLLSRAQHGSSLPTGVVLVVDEAGMVGTRQLAAVVDLVDQADGKLVLVGDDKQLPEIDAGGLFRALANRLPAVELTDNVRQQAAWERQALDELRNGSVQQAMQAYVEHRRLILGRNRTDAVTRACADWYRYVRSSGEIGSALLIAHDNDTVTELNEKARQHLAASGHLHGPTHQAAGIVLQAGDRILCRRNRYELDVLNGDLGTITVVDQDAGTVTVRLDRDPETRELPDWYLNDAKVGYGYALTAHKAQGITTGRTFTVITGTTDREWAYVALSRGRNANTLYLASPEPGHQECSHLTHQTRQQRADAPCAFLTRSRAQIAATDREEPRGAGLFVVVGHDGATCARRLTQSRPGLPVFGW
jgi:hypothetical protein